MLTNCTFIINILSFSFSLKPISGTEDASMLNIYEYIAIVSPDDEIEDSISTENWIIKPIFQAVSWKAMQ